jgi:hypothetical protein
MDAKRCDFIDVGGGDVIVRGRCKVTGEIHETPPVPREALWDHLGGAKAQAALPMLPFEEREFLISGTSPEGWRRTFGATRTTPWPRGER